MSGGGNARARRRSTGYRTTEEVQGRGGVRRASTWALPSPHPRRARRRRCGRGHRWANRRASTGLPASRPTARRGRVLPAPEVARLLLYVGT